MPTMPTSAFAVSSSWHRGKAVLQARLLDIRQINWHHIWHQLLSKWQKRPQSLIAQSRFVSGFPRGRWDRNRTCTLRFWSPGFVSLWAFMRCGCMSPFGIVRGRIGRQVSRSVGLVRSCRGQLQGATHTARSRGKLLQIADCPFLCLLAIEGKTRRKLQPTDYKIAVDCSSAFVWPVLCHELRPKGGAQYVLVHLLPALGSEMGS